MKTIRIEIQGYGSGGDGCSAGGLPYQANGGGGGGAGAAHFIQPVRTRKLSRLIARLLALAFAFLLLSLTVQAADMPPAPAPYVTNAHVTYVSNRTYRGYLCQYPGDVRWYACWQVYVDLPDGKRYIFGMTPKPGAK